MPVRTRALLPKERLQQKNGGSRKSGCSRMPAAVDKNSCCRKSRRNLCEPLGLGTQQAYSVRATNALRLRGA